MKENELEGTLVLVRPDMKFDPAGQRGQVGIVTYANELDDIYVSFGDAEGVYSSDVLFKLRNKADIFSEVMNSNNLKVKDFKDLYKIAQLQDIGRPKDFAEALKIAGNNAAIWERALEPTGETLAQRQAQKMGR